MSIGAGPQPAPADGAPPGPRAPERGLRDRPLGRIALFVLVLLAALVVARTCGAHDEEVSQDEAVAIATEQAGFTPCEERGCVVVRAVQRGIPTQLYWLVGLAEAIGDDGPSRFASYLVNAQTGAVTAAG